jgi:hypothetical protein
MEKELTFLEGLKRHIGKPGAAFGFGEITEVGDTTCSVKLSDGTQIEDVRLKAAINENKDYIISRPKVGSTVILGTLDENTGECFVIACDEIDEYEINMGNVVLIIKEDIAKINANGSILELKEGKVMISSAKITLKNSQTNLKKILTKLYDLLETFSVLCAAPGSVSAPNPAMLVDINLGKLEINKLLSDD